MLYHKTRSYRLKIISPTAKKKEEKCFPLQKRKDYIYEKFSKFCMCDMGIYSNGFGCQYQAFCAIM
jgi:hypothetical protein